MSTTASLYSFEYVFSKLSVSTLGEEYPNLVAVMKIKSRLTLKHLSFYGRYFCRSACHLTKEGITHYLDTLKNISRQEKKKEKSSVQFMTKPEHILP